jgi:hypothetical protein
VGQSGLHTSPADHLAPSRRSASWSRSGSGSRRGSACETAACSGAECRCFIDCFAEDGETDVPIVRGRRESEKPARDEPVQDLALLLAVRPVRMDEEYEVV